jgi:septal ring factor EnvC (AmiA/AmiB activator)
MDSFTVSSMSAAQTFIPSGLENDDAQFLDLPFFGPEPSTKLATPDTHSATVAGDWQATLGLVQRAAALIKSYEQKLRIIEEETHEYMLRNEDEKQRLNERNQDLEKQVAHLESALSHTADELHETKRVATEFGTKLRDTESRLEEANAQIKVCTSYRRQVEEILGAI